MTDALVAAIDTLTLPTEVKEQLASALIYHCWNANVILPHFDERAHPFILADLETRCRKSVIVVHDHRFDWRTQPPNWLAKWHDVHHTLRPFVLPYVISWIHPATIT